MNFQISHDNLVIRFLQPLLTLLPTTSICEHVFREFPPAQCGILLARDDWEIATVEQWYYLMKWDNTFTWRTLCHDYVVSLPALYIETWTWNWSTSKGFVLVQMRFLHHFFITVLTQCYQHCSEDSRACSFPSSFSRPTVIFVHSSNF